MYPCSRFRILIRAIGFRMESSPTGCLSGAEYSACCCRARLRFPPRWGRCERNSVAAVHDVALHRASTSSPCDRENFLRLTRLVGEAEETPRLMGGGGGGGGARGGPIDPCFRSLPARPAPGYQPARRKMFRPGCPYLVLSRLRQRGADPAWDPGAPARQRVPSRCASRWPFLALPGHGGSRLRGRVTGAEGPLKSLCCALITTSTAIPPSTLAQTTFSDLFSDPDVAR